MTDPLTSANDLNVTDLDALSPSTSPQARGRTIKGLATDAVPTGRAIEGLDTNALPTAIRANWPKLERSQLSRKVRMRLSLLASDRFALTPSDARNMRPKSLSDFLDFWEDVRDDAVEPEIALSRDGSLVAEWFKSSKQRLNVKFSQDVLMFGLLDNGNILEGAQGAETVSSILQSHKSQPLRWHG